MNAKRLSALLEKLEACSDAQAWAEGKTLAQAWFKCVRADWMCWLLVRMIGKRGWPDKRVVRHALCDCAETALKYTKDPRPAETIRVARLYADGKATDVELAAARYAARDATGDAARAAARAAAGDAAWATAGDAAGEAARHAARAAARAAAWDAAWDAALKDIAGLVRKRCGKFAALKGGEHGRA